MSRPFCRTAIRFCRRLLVALISLLPVLGIAQGAPQSADLKSAKEIVDTFNKELNNRGPASPDQPKDLTGFAYRVIFLHDPSHVAGNDDPETDFVRKTIEDVIDELNRFEQPSSARQPANAHFVEYFPYQLNLYRDQAKQNVRVDAKASAEIAGALLTQPNPVDTDGSKLDYSNPHDLPGHDNVDSRYELTRLLSQRLDDRPDLIVQITTNEISRNKHHPDLDAKIRGLTSDQNRTLMVDNSFVPYARLIGDYDPSSTPDVHIRVYFWLYGPNSPSPHLVLTVAKPAPPSPPEKPEPSGWDQFMGWIDKNDATAAMIGAGILLVLGAAGFSAYWFTGSASLTINGSTFNLKRGGEVRIAAPDSVPPKTGLSFVVPQSQFNGTASGTLAVLRFTTGIVLTGIAGTIEEAGRAPRPSISLVRGKEAKVTLNGSTFKVPLRIKVT